MDEDLTITEAAELYGCSRANMSYLVKTQRLPFVRIGKLIVLKRRDVLALREARDSRKQSNTWIERIERVAA